MKIYCKDCLELREFEKIFRLKYICNCMSPGKIQIPYYKCKTCGYEIHKPIREEKEDDRQL